MFHSKTYIARLAVLVLCTVQTQANAAVTASSGPQEPNVALLLGFGLIAIGLVRWKRNSP